MAELSAGLSGRLGVAGLDPGEVVRVVRMALAEDLGGGADVTTAATIPAGAVGTAELVSRVAGVVAGLSVIEVVFALPGQPAPAVLCRQLVADGERVAAGQVLMTVRGPLAVILTAERTALNLLCHLSGVATLTRRWVDAVAGTDARIRDTRKTLPGLRALQKYAVRCGGGENHRMSLSDAALIKDNHVAAAGSVSAALAAVAGRLGTGGRPGVAAGLIGAGGSAGATGPASAVVVEVECDTLDQVAEAVEAGAGLILLDNFTVDQMARAVAVTGGRARLEASGGLRLSSAGEVAATGVDFLAVGALTHSAPALDIGLDLVETG